MIRLALALLMAGCGPADASEYESVDGLFSDLCEGRCYAADTCPALWGYTHADGRVCIVESQCWDDLTMCAFVVRHEVCHAAANMSEPEADCCAAQMATDAQIAAALRYFCDRRPARCEAVAECSMKGP